MGNEKFTWVIKNFSSDSESKTIVSDKFVIGGCKWCLVAFPTGNQFPSHLSLYLMVASYKTLPCGWRRHTRFSITVVNHLSSQEKKEDWFDEYNPLCGYSKMLPLTKLNAEEGGFVVNDEVKIIAEVDVLEVIGELDVSEESHEVEPLKRMRLNGDDGAVSSHLDKETSLVDVNGFLVLPSQAESVKRIFEKHPDMALEFRVKDQNMRTSCINLLLNIINTLCQSLQDLSTDDLSQEEKVLTYLKDSGFKVDWLERKLEEVKNKKIEEQFSKTQIQVVEEKLKIFKQKCSEIEALLEKEKEELKDSKQKCSDMEALLEKEKTKVLAAARAPPLTLDDVV
ncbi:MATH domain and coiled-coil domain-containing protein At3g44800 [Capsella rubella]|uniref:MATH domain and coiled-coil domain-containing protein At3g44800 n=1 Tax=Capsella rubella TaxID=81985 RepID=UPI000CD51346|nr:MATH domain and coiled-coil domain-containing protein At3g44800 [Capsella rubella]